MQWLVVCISLRITTTGSNNDNNNNIVIGAHGTVPKGLVQGQEDLEIKGQVETIQTAVFIRLA